MANAHLSQSIVARKPPPYSHKNTLVWQFLVACRPGDGELGDLIRRLRDRTDMPRSFSHKTAMLKYLHQCKIDSATCARNVQHLYNLYLAHVQQARHPPDETVVSHVAPSQLARSGVSRDQIALAVLTGLGLFSDPRQNFNEGGKWTESAYGAADAVIELLTLRAQGDQI